MSGPRSPVCRFCQSPLEITFADLGKSPLCETFLDTDQLNQMEPFFPLHVYVCERCLLVQLEEYVDPEGIFGHYPYFSSYSDTWLAHARRYAETMVARLALGPDSLVVELGSNDGYLLQYFVAAGIPVLGVEPAANVAETAVANGIRTRVAFFSESVARDLVAEGKPADLVVGNNVLAQIPDLNSFVRGVQLVLAPGGTATFEFPHLIRLVEGHQFDTIYHEHFSYFSLMAAQTIFAAHRLTVFDVEELATHGGSLRIYLRHADDARPVEESVAKLLESEERAGVASMEFYRGFAPRVEETKRKLLHFLIEAKWEGKSVAAYGAPGKGNTLLNYCGIRTDFLDYAVDRNPYKHGRFLPGTHVPVFPPDRVAETRPDFLLILPWNLRHEIMEQMSQIRDWGGRFVVPIPEVRVYD